MTQDKQISRRELLRTVCLAGAAAWAAPVMTSTRAAASVDRCTKRKAQRLCGGSCEPCYAPDAPCGTCSSDVGDGSYCFQRFGDLKCYCGEDVFCSETHACTSDADCSDFAPGICITNNGCTGCRGEAKGGVCTTRCCTPLAEPAHAPRRRGPRRLGGTLSGKDLKGDRPKR
jgi:hypothetical protein